MSSGLVSFLKLPSADLIYNNHQVHLLLPARPWDAAFFQFFSKFYAPFSPLRCGTCPRLLYGFLPVPQAEVCSNLPLLCLTLSISTCHSCSSSALTAFSTCTLTAMPLASANLFNLQGLAHASFYTNQLLHQPAFMHKHCFTLNH